MEKNKKEEWIERYLYDVVRRLPEKQRKDIEEELRTLIEDMMAEKEEDLTKNHEECVKEVLKDLGNPLKLARSYRGEQDSLISGEYYDTYCFALKIVMICTLAGIVVSNIVSALIHVIEAENLTTGIWNDMLNIGMAPMALVFAFGAVTLIFACMEKYQIKVNGQEWNLEKLPQIPYKKAMISRYESAVGIIFGVVGMILLAFTPQLLGAWIQKDGRTLVSIPIFNLEVWKSVLPLFIGASIAGLTTDLIKLVVGRYNYTVMTVTIVMDTISFGLTFFLFKTFPVWNSNFVPEFQEALGKTFSSKQFVRSYFGKDIMTDILLAIILFAFLLDIGTTVYYTVRYKNSGVKKVR